MYSADNRVFVLRGKPQGYLLVCVLIISAFLTVTSCENTFEPLQQNDNYVFSMYGSLDVHADTQWVRVMPIGETLIPVDTTAGKTEVTITRESTGQVIALNDSLFRFGGSTFVRNYWTSEEIIPNESYKIIAESEDGRQSSTTVKTPSVLPLPEVEYSVENEWGLITGVADDNLVTAEIRYLVQVMTEMGCTPETEVILTHLDELYINPDGEYRIRVDDGLTLAREFGVPRSRMVVNRRRLVVVTASEDWPVLEDLTQKEIELPEVISNVEQGTGFISGIARRYVEISQRQEPC